MKLYIFRDGSGAFSGTVTAVVEPTCTGTLKIGNESIFLIEGEPKRLPLLQNGGAEVSFYDTEDNHYKIGVVNIRNGRIENKPQHSDLFCRMLKRIELIEDKLSIHDEEINALGKVFDTDSLNFLIKEEEN